MLRLLRSIPICCGAASALMLSGCIPYPTHKTLQPAATITVLDEASQPISDARVVLIAGAYPYGFDRFREEARTSADGRARFEARHEWRVEVLAIHGSEVFFWNWCVEKPGYETYETQDRNADKFDDNAAIHLKAGESRSCNNPGESPFMREPPAPGQPGAKDVAPTGDRPAPSGTPVRATDNAAPAVKP
mgnify:FL=1